MRTTLCTVLLLTACSQVQPEPVLEVSDFPALEQDLNGALNTWTAAYRAAVAGHDDAKIAHLQADRPEPVFVAHWQEAAASRAGTPAAVPFLVGVVARGSPAQARAAMTELMAHFPDDPGISRAVARIGGLHEAFGLDQSRGWLDRVLERNTTSSVLRQAHYTRAALYVGTRAAAHGEELRQLAITDLRAVLAGGTEDSLGGLGAALMQEAEHLEPGLTAPDIEGEDLDGAKVRLSDYRGKVVLLDFWGDW
jgi:hypothetical protein